MSVKWKKLTAADYVTAAWSGGTTTQIAIAPEGAVYADRDFLWRVSSAVVELEESDFTALPDYRRLIAPLRGEMTLTHGVGAPVTLAPYEVHAFEGGDHTHSRGRCTDFNLMLRRGAADGTMEAIRLSGERRSVDADRRTEELLLYCAEGSVTAGAEGTELRAGEALYVPPADACPLELAGEGVVMLCRIRRL